MWDEPEWERWLWPRESRIKMSQIEVSEPHVIAKVRLFQSEEGGRPSAILAPHFTCPMEVAGELFTCRLYLPKWAESTRVARRSCQSDSLPLNSFRTNSNPAYRSNLGRALFCER
jgi:hypothetical protein